MKGGVIKQINNAINITNKLLALTESQLLPHLRGDKWGFCDQDKKIVINCIYDNAFFFNDGLALIKLKNKWGFIDVEGTQIITLHVLAPFKIEGSLEILWGSVIVTEVHIQIGDILFKGDLLMEFENNIASWEIKSHTNGVLLYSACKGEKILPNKCVAITAQSNKEIPVTLFAKVNNYVSLINKHTLFSAYSNMEWI